MMDAKNLKTVLKTEVGIMKVHPVVTTFNYVSSFVGIMKVRLVFVTFKHVVFDVQKADPQESMCMCLL